MELTDAVRTRRMIRSYDPDRGVPRDLLNMLIKLAIRAPSAGHTQGRRILVLDDITSRQKFWSATSSGPPDSWRSRMEQAPVLVIVFSDRQAYLDRYAEADKARSSLSTASTGAAPPDDWPIPYWHVDAGMVAMILLLAAHDAGLGACFFGVPAAGWDDLSTAFDVPAGLAPVGVISLGYPARAVAPRSARRPLKTFDEQVAYGSFGPASGR